MNPKIVTCDDCGQKNRMPAADDPRLGPGKIIVCGACKVELDADAVCDACGGAGEVELEDGSDESMPCPACGGGL